MTQTTPTRDEAVRKIQSECDACFGVGRIEDPASSLVLGGFKDCPDCKGSGWVWKEYATSAPAPASGGVDAVGRIAEFLKERDEGVLPEEIDDAERQASAEEIIRLASLSPAATTVSETTNGPKYHERKDAELKRIAARLAELSPSEGLFCDGGDFVIEFRWTTDSELPAALSQSTAGRVGE